MTQYLRIGVVTVAMVLAVVLVSADTYAKPTKGIVVGTAVELSTYAMKGLGEEHIDAMVNRAEQGFPVGIIDEETGALWVCIYRSSAPASPIVTANNIMKPFLGKKVAAQGIKYEAESANVLRLSVISEY